MAKNKFVYEILPFFNVKLWFSFNLQNINQGVTSTSRQILFQRLVFSICILLLFFMTNRKYFLMILDIKFNRPVQSLVNCDKAFRLSRGKSNISNSVCSLLCPQSRECILIRVGVSEVINLPKQIFGLLSRRAWDIKLSNKSRQG